MITFQAEVNNKIKNFAAISNGIRIELSTFTPQETKEEYSKKLWLIKSLNLLYKNTDRSYRKGDYCPLIDEVISDEKTIQKYIDEYDNNKMYWQNKTNKLNFIPVYTKNPLEATTNIIDTSHFLKDTIKLLKEMFFADYDNTPFLLFSFRSNNPKLVKARNFNTDLKIIQQLYSKKNDFFTSYVKDLSNTVLYKNHQMVDYKGNKISFIDLLKEIEENSTNSLHDTAIKTSINQWITTNTELINSL